MKIYKLIDIFGKSVVFYGDGKTYYMLGCKYRNGCDLYSAINKGSDAIQCLVCQEERGKQAIEGSTGCEVGRRQCDYCCPEPEKGTIFDAIALLSKLSANHTKALQLAEDAKFFLELRVMGRYYPQLARRSVEALITLLEDIAP